MKLTKPVRRRVPLYEHIDLLMFASCAEVREWLLSRRIEMQVEGGVPDEMIGGLASVATPFGVLMAIDPDRRCSEVIAHEAVHAAWAILDSAGVKVTADNHEALAYMVTWIVKTWNRAMA